MTTPPATDTNVYNKAYQAANGQTQYYSGPASGFPGDYKAPVSSPPVPTSAPAGPVINAQGLVDGAAPAGSSQSAGGFWVSPGGLRYTQAPSTSKVPRYGNAPADVAQSDLMTSAQPESQADIQARIESQYADEIAAVKGLYTSMLTGQQKVGEQNKGRTRAAAAASGILGGDMGDTALAGADTTEQQAEASIQAEEAAKIAAIGTEVSGKVESEYQTQRSNYQNLQEQSIAYLQGKAKDTQAQIATVATTTDLKDLPQATYDQLYATAGFDTPEEFNAYYTASRNAALMGVKLVGDATTGYYMPKVGSDGKVQYENVIKGKPVTGSIGASGAYIYDEATGEVKTIAPTVPTIRSAGGQLWSVDPKTQKATPLTPKAAGVSKIGWGADTSSTLAVQSYSEGNVAAYNEKYGTNYTADQLIQAAKSSPDAFLVILNEALGAGIYTPATVYNAPDTSGATNAADDAANAAADAAASVSGG